MPRKSALLFFCVFSISAVFLSKAVVLASIVIAAKALK
jgi:hypothetical protein